MNKSKILKPYKYDTVRITEYVKLSIIAVFLGTVLVGASFLPFQTFLPSSAYYESRPNLANGVTWIQEVGYFVSGSHVKLDISVYGGDNKISAQVVNKELINITKELEINGNGAFSLEISENGVYGLRLRNPNLFSNNNEQILVKSYYYFYNYIFLALGILLIVSGSVPTVYFRKLENKENWRKGKQTLEEKLKLGGRVDLAEASKITGVKMDKIKQFLLELGNEKAAFQGFFVNNDKHFILKSFAVDSGLLTGRTSFADLGSKLGIKESDAKKIVIELLHEKKVIGALTLDGRGFLAEAIVIDEIRKLQYEGH